MKILFLYTKRMLAANKARTAVTFAGIVLSFALLTAVITGTSSLFHFFSEYMKMRDGDYYGVIYNCDEEDEARLAQSGEVMQICRMGIVGVAEKNFGIEHEVSLSNRVYVAIGSVDADFFATMGVRLIEGRLPENDSEVIIPQMMTTAGKEFHVGDTITWQIGERIGSDGRVIQHQEQRIEDRSSADFCEEETIQVEQTKTYTIVGVSTNPGYQKFAEPCYLVLTTGVQTTISDIYDAMLSARSYKKEKIPFDVLHWFVTEGSKGIDQNLLNIFIKNMVKVYRQQQVIMSDGREGCVEYIPLNDMDHPIVSVGEEVRQVDEDWYCVHMV